MEEPKSAKRSRRHYQLWKLARTLELDEIEWLISKRRQDLRHEGDRDKIRDLRTDIVILERTHRIKKKEDRK